MEKVLTAAKLREILGYDPTTGAFWRKVKPTRGLAKDGDPTIRGPNNSLVISVDGAHYPANRLAWMYVNGEWPSGLLIYVNGNHRDLRIDNLSLKKVDRSKELTLERLREALDYDTTTGMFTWKIGTARGRPGTRAGVVTPIGYRYMSIDGQRYLAHRLAWFYAKGKWPEWQIDHINGDVDDNRLSNLREATPAQNAQNSRHKAGGSGYRGVRQKGRRYEAVIYAHNFRRSLGWFDSAEKAHQAYMDAAKKYHGDYAHKNDPPE